MSNNANRPFTSLSREEQLAFWSEKLHKVLGAQEPAQASAPAAAAPAPTSAPAQVPVQAAVDPVLGQRLIAAKAAIDEANRKETLALARVKTLEEELSVSNRKALKAEAENAAAVAALQALWNEENTAKLAAQAEVGQLREELAKLKEELAAASSPAPATLGIMPDDWTAKVQELVTFLGSQEGKELKAAFAAGDDDAKDLVLALAVKPVTDMVARVPYGQVELVGRAIDLIGGLVTEALKDRLEEGKQLQSASPAPAVTPSHLSHPLKKGKARRGGQRHGPIEELADMVAEGGLRLRRA